MNEIGFIPALLGIVFLFIQGVILLFLKFAVSTINLTYKEVSATNGKVGKLNTWAEFHQKQDDERHDLEREDRRDLWTEVNKLKKD